MSRKTLVHLDPHEYDTADALAYLSVLVEQNRIAGMIFAVVQKRGHPPLFGATGRLASNGIEATGLAAILEDQLSQPFLNCADHPHD